MNLLKALATVSSMTLLSRILGFVRDTIIARIFGAGLLPTPSSSPSSIPNLLRRLFAEGAFSQAFVPILAEYKTRKGARCHARPGRPCRDRCWRWCWWSSAGSASLAAPVVIYISAPGFAADPEKFDLTVTLLRITFPYIFFISLVSLAAGMLNTYSKFSVPAFTPVLLNLSFIVAARCGWRRTSIRR